MTPEKISNTPEISLGPGAHSRLVLGQASGDIHVIVKPPKEHQKQLSGLIEVGYSGGGIVPSQE